MDLWALLLNRSTGVAAPNWTYVGRWFLHLPSGKIFHADIATSKSFPFESEARWIAHYVTGIVYVGALLKIMGEFMHTHRRFFRHSFLLGIPLQRDGLFFNPAWVPDGLHQNAITPGPFVS